MLFEFVRTSKNGSLKTLSSTFWYGAKNVIVYNFSHLGDLAKSVIFSSRYLSGYKVIRY